MYVVSIENITDPLYVFKDYGNDGLNFFAHYLTNVGVLILEIEFLINLIFVYILCFRGEVFQCGDRKLTLNPFWALVAVSRIFPLDYPDSTNEKTRSW